MKSGQTPQLAPRRAMIGRTAIAASAFVALLAGAVPSDAQRMTLLPAPACAADRVMQRVELVFGLSRPGGGMVSDADWAGFLEAEVTPRFPQGLTVLTASGQWRDAGGAIQKEPSRILVILYPPTSAADSGIEAIRAAYKTRFEQESVMRVDAASCVSF
jgi:hypothetical protein